MTLTDDRAMAPAAMAGLRVIPKNGKRTSRSRAARWPSFARTSSGPFAYNVALIPIAMGVPGQARLATTIPVSLGSWPSGGGTRREDGSGLRGQQGPPKVAHEQVQVERVEGRRLELAEALVEPPGAIVFAVDEQGTRGDLLGRRCRSGAHRSCRTRCVRAAPRSRRVVRPGSRAHRRGNAFEREGAGPGASLALASAKESTKVRGENEPSQATARRAR